MSAIQNSEVRRNLHVRDNVGRRHWLVFRTIRDMAPDAVTFGEVERLTELDTPAVATSIDYLYRHSFIERIKNPMNSKVSYKASGRIAKTMDELLIKERPKPLTKVRGAGVRRKLAYLVAQKAEQPKARTGILRTNNAKGVQATAFVRLQINNEAVEVTYAEANRLWEELGKVFVRS